MFPNFVIAIFVVQLVRIGHLLNSYSKQIGGSILPERLLNVNNCSCSLSKAVSGPIIDTLQARTWNVEHWGVVCTVYTSKLAH